MKKNIIWILNILYVGLITLQENQLIDVLPLNTKWKTTIHALVFVAIAMLNMAIFGKRMTKINKK